MNALISTKNFAIIGVGGYVAPRHLRAIRDTGNRLVAAVDPRDSVGVLDQYSFDVRFFTEIERFDRHLEKLRRGPPADRVQYVTILSPNYLHDAHCRLALRVGADAICEKPLVINPWNLDQLAAIEEENPALKGILPRTYQSFTNATLVSLLRSVNAILGDIEGDAFGKVYEYFLGKFAVAEGAKGGNTSRRPRSSG